jgi:hypothetical protein
MRRYIVNKFIFIAFFAFVCCNCFCLNRNEYGVTGVHLKIKGRVNGLRAVINGDENVRIFSPNEKIVSSRGIEDASDIAIIFKRNIQSIMGRTVSIFDENREIISLVVERNNGREQLFLRDGWVPPEGAPKFGLYAFLLGGGINYTLVIGEEIPNFLRNRGGSKLYKEVTRSRSVDTAH